MYETIWNIIVVNTQWKEIKGPRRLPSVLLSSQSWQQQMSALTKPRDKQASQHSEVNEAS